VVTLAELVQHIRHVVLEHPGASNLPVVLTPHGGQRNQPTRSVELNMTKTAVVIEAQR
jgi:hypothetical protein